MQDLRIKGTITEIMARLVRGDYWGVEQRTGGLRLSAEELRQAVAEYGRHLRMPPLHALDAVEAVEIDGSNPKAWSVVCEMWTEEEGRSDLSLELTLTDSGDQMQVEVDNLHVL